ncbi:DUF3298 domain-containing protein [Legionella sp. D16C41]|uniref:DUF3298 and DUF4163 domain-containing protein n=1 Tax=Legionella sp. D16C41 TaxID=3402688 RepID=UPI003AF5009B
MYLLRMFILGLSIVTNPLWAQPKTVTVKKETKTFILELKYPQGFNQGQIDQVIQTFITTTKNAQNMSDSDSFTETLPGKNSLYIDYRIAFQNKHVVSLEFDVSTYSSGAAHPNNTIRTFNFIDGKQINLKDIFKPNVNYLTTIANYCRAELLKKKDFDKKWINDGTEAEIENYSDWTFDKKGLAIIFDTYQVAAYVYGPQTIIIPQSLLETALRPEVKKIIWGNA